MSPADSASQKFSRALVERHLGVRAKRKSIFYALSTASAPTSLRELERMSGASDSCVANTVLLMLDLGLVKEVDPIPPARCPYCSQGVHLRAEDRLRWYCDHCHHVGQMARSYLPIESQETDTAQRRP